MCRNRKLSKSKILRAFNSSATLHGTQYETKMQVSLQLLTNIDMYSFYLRVPKTMIRIFALSMYEETTHVSRAYCPNSLPMPDCLYPPNGTFISVACAQLTYIPKSAPYPAFHIARSMITYPNTASLQGMRDPNRVTRVFRKDVRPKSICHIIRHIKHLCTQFTMLVTPASTVADNNLTHLPQS